MTLTYTLNRLMVQQAVVQRNVATEDAFGAEDKATWEFLANYPCKLWWDKNSGVRSASRTYPGLNRDVPISEGGIILPLGSDINEEDRITSVIDGAGNELFEGIFEISMVLNQLTHTEVFIVRPHLGA